MNVSEAIKAYRSMILSEHVCEEDETNENSLYIDQKVVDEDYEDFKEWADIVMIVDQEYDPEYDEMNYCYRTCRIKNIPYSVFKRGLASIKQWINNYSNIEFVDEYWETWSSDLFLIKRIKVRPNKVLSEDGEYYV